MVKDQLLENAYSENRVYRLEWEASLVIFNSYPTCHLSDLPLALLWFVTVLFFFVSV